MPALPGRAPRAWSRQLVDSQTRMTSPGPLPGLRRSADAGPGGRRRPTARAASLRPAIGLTGSGDRLRRKAPATARAEARAAPRRPHPCPSDPSRRPPAGSAPCAHARSAPGRASVVRNPPSARFAGEHMASLKETAQLLAKIGRRDRAVSDMPAHSLAERSSGLALAPAPWRIPRTPGPIDREIPVYLPVRAVRRRHRRAYVRTRLRPAPPFPALAPAVWCMAARTAAPHLRFEAPRRGGRGEVFIGQSLKRRAFARHGRRQCGGQGHRAGSGFGLGRVCIWHVVRTSASHRRDPRTYSAGAVLRVRARR